MKQVKSGTEGLDALLAGGLPERRNILVSGSSGTGKTILGAQFLREGAEHDEASLLISFEQDEQKLSEDLLQINIDIAALSKTGKFKTIGGPIGTVQRVKTKTKASKEDILAEIEQVIKKYGAKRVVVDSINLFFMLFASPEKRDALAQLCSLLSDKGCTAILTSEVPEGSRKLSAHGFEEFVVDGVIAIYRIAYENTFERAISVVKMRGVAHSKTVRALKISNQGLKVYPDQEPYHKNIAGT